MSMHDMDDIIPEFEARYQTGQEDQKSGLENDAARETADRNFTIRISKSFPLMQSLPQAGEGKDVYLVEHDGTPRILKFFNPEMIPGEEFFRRAKDLSERLHAVFLTIHEYGFDENTRRWYMIQEYAAHGSLQTLAEAGIDLKELPGMIEALLEGLKVLHERHIVHLNLKPSNILLRESHPPLPVFSDVSGYSVTGSAHTAKVPPLADRRAYAAPELLTGDAGKEADYWSLGMILLVLLLGRPLADDDQEVMKILSVHHPVLPERIPEEYAALLRGLLNHEPAGRWGYSEAKRWLQKDAGVPLQGPGALGEAVGDVPRKEVVPFRFLNKDYFSMPEMVPAFLKGEEAWAAAADNLEKGHIAAWLIKNSNTALRSKIDAMKEQYAGDPDLALIGLIYTIQRDLPFVFHGKLITRKNLSIYASRSLRHESSSGEETVLRCLLNGKLSEYYREYAMLSARADEELISLFEVVRKAVSRKGLYEEKLAALSKMLNIIAMPSAYLLPPKIGDNITGNLYAIAENIDVVIPFEAYQELIGSLIIPEALKEKISIAVSADLGPSYAGGLEKLRDGSLLTQEEFARLKDTCLLPDWLTCDLLGKETSPYLAAMALLRKLKAERLLIEKDALLDYLRNYSTFIALVFTTAVAVPQGKKGESPEQRWFRWLKSDISREEYLALARHIKNRSALSVFSKIEEIITRLSGQAVFSDSAKELLRAVEVLKSGEVPWDENDRQMVLEIHSLATQKGSTLVQAIEKITQGVMGKGVHAFLMAALGIDADEQTREAEGAFAGFAVGIFLGFVAWPVIVSLELNLSFYGPSVLGLLAGLAAKSIPLAILLASAGAAGTFFSGMETPIEVVYAFLLALFGGSRIGAFAGRRLRKYSSYDDVAHKYHDRLVDIVNAAETPAD